MSRYYKFLRQLKYGSQFAFIFVVFIFFLAAYSYLVGTPYFDAFELWAEDNYWRLVGFLLILKIVGIVWPPIPGVIPLIGSIPVLGWFPALLIDAIGYMIGSTIAFYLARSYGIIVIHKLFGESGVKQVEKFRIKPERELEAISLMKIFGGGIGEFISYAAGVTRMRFINFFWGNLISIIVVSLPLFYFFSFAFSENNLLYALVPLGIGLLLFYLLRRRYFEWE
ncbi:MAG TPA: VTT domain-containing protein [Candidatus Doudnabacteria bacterium]|nr:VTT domain-containing protein [Candidatus Doudnabacteria bacterium]